MSRRIADLLLGARLAVAGGTSSRVRATMTAIGVGLGVALLLFAASVPSMIDRGQERDAARGIPVGASPHPGDRTVVVRTSDTTYLGDDIRGRDLEADGAHPALPPGLSAVPAPGTMVVSPALAERLRGSDGGLLRERLDARVVGEIGRAGLFGPRELSFYRGVSGLKAKVAIGYAQRISAFGDGAGPDPLGPLLTLVVAIAVIVLLLPIAVFVGAAVRFGGDDRDRRLAALRLVGADRAMAARMAAGETLLGAVAGVLVGGGLFLALRPLVEGIELEHVSVFAADVQPRAALVALILVAVPVSAVVVSLLALRRVVIEPLGVVRRAAGARRRLWWRIVPGAIGVALLAPLRDGLPTSGGGHEEYRAAAGVFFGLVAVTAVLPWLVEVSVRRLRGGALSWQLATRRLQIDGGTAARVVSGIAVAVAGAIALQTLFTAAERESTRRVYYQDGQARLAELRPGATADVGERAQVSVLIGGAPNGATAGPLVRALRSTAGVTGVTGSARVYAVPRGHPDRGVQLLVGGCAALRDYARIPDCRRGGVYLPTGPASASPVIRAGRSLELGDGSRTVRWTVPAGLRKVEALPDPGGGLGDVLLATPGALGGVVLPRPQLQAFVRFDPRDDDTLERVRNGAVGVDAGADVIELTPTRTAHAFQTVRRGVFAGAVAVLVLIGASLLVGALEQLRERRRVLAVLVAFGTRRSTMASSVMWQALVPVGLGLAVSVAMGAVLGALLLSMASEPIIFDWGAIAGMAGAGGAVVLLVTLLSMPALWRLMRPDGLRTE